VDRPRFVPRPPDEREEDVEQSNVVRLVLVDEEDGCCKSACADEADVVSQTWLHHTELFG
jgi:hypothetical protein